MKPHRGFTLLELLIGMTLLGFILALLFSGFRLASTSWDAVERQVERTTEEEMARALLRRLLPQLQPMRWKRATNQAIAFVGEPSGFRAIAPLSGQAGSSGLRVIEFAAETYAADGKDAARLILRQGPLVHEAPDFAAGLAEAKPHTILNGLTAVEFSYFGPDRQGATPQWQGTWTNEQQLPQLIRVGLVSPDAGWTDVFVAPMIGGTGCNWDNFYKRCR